jgi:REP element-mobilizing transposase RayT
MWNLSPPPGFQGLHADRPLTVYLRHLPHWRQDGATYFVTFRLADSLPHAKLDELAFLKVEHERRRALLRPSPETGLVNSNGALERWARATQELVEPWLDLGMGSCVLKQPAMAGYVIAAMHYFDNERYELDCYSVMPNHVHAVLRPLFPAGCPLETVVGGWKKRSSRAINQAVARRGELWQEESYDRIIRDEEHLWRVIQYIGSNPSRAGFACGVCPLWIRPQWADLGWRFEEPMPAPARTGQETRPT